MVESNFIHLEQVSVTIDFIWENCQPSTSNLFLAGGYTDLGYKG
jgi:hypothetical protein